MQELRRVRSGVLDENKHVTTLHDILDAQYLYDSNKDESYLRRIIHPLELLLLDYKRIVVKDSAVNAITYGAKLMIPGVLRYADDIEVNDVVVLMTTKGEAIALGIAEMTTCQMSECDHGTVRRSASYHGKRYVSKTLGFGPIALRKKKLKAEGLLDKYGRPNDKTPKDWNKVCPPIASRKSRGGSRGEVPRRRRNVREVLVRG